MEFTNKSLKYFSKITKKLPPHRKLNQVYKNFNKLFLALGADSITTAEMNDGTTMVVDLSTKTERTAYYTGHYDSDLIEVVHALLKPNSFFLDVGANIGFYTVSVGNFMRTNNFTGKVISFEPFEGNYKRLSENLNNNNLSEYCYINHYGLSNKTDTCEITLREDFKNGSNTGNAAIPTDINFDKGFKRSPIFLEKLDDVWTNFDNNLNTIEVVKMDIEGHEDFCLDGGKLTFSKHRPSILMEVNKPYYEARNVDLDTRFFSLIPENYKVFKQDGIKWKLISSFDECIKIDNVFLIPNEKLNLDGYHIFETELKS